MFFIMGITQGRKDFEYRQLMTCSLCGAYGSNVTIHGNDVLLYKFPYAGFLCDRK